MLTWQVNSQQRQRFRDWDATFRVPEKELFCRAAPL
jgi:hypothetical protein